MKRVQFSITMKPATRAAVEAAARADGRSMSVWIERACERALLSAAGEGKGVLASRVAEDVVYAVPGPRDAGGEGL